MKTCSLLIVLFCLANFNVSANQRSVTSILRANFRSSSSSSTEASSLPLSKTVNLPRGGFNLATTTAQATSVFLGGNGITLLLNPNAVLRKVYQIDPPEDDGLSSTLMRAAGSMSLGVAITVYTSIVQQRPLPRAVGLGLLPRIGCFLWILAVFQRTKFLVINTAMASFCAFSLLRGTPNAPTTWKFFSCVSLLKGLWLVVAPKPATRKFLGVSKVENKSQALSRALGNEAVASAILMGSLALGAQPTQAAGYTCLAWMVLLADMAWRDKTWKLMEDSPDTQYVHMVISAVLGIGFLLS